MYIYKLMTLIKLIKRYSFIHGDKRYKLDSHYMKIPPLTWLQYNYINTC